MCECGLGFQATEQGFRDFFLGSPSTCARCRSPLDWWKAALRSIRKSGFLGFAAIGANITVRTIRLEPGVQYELDLSDQGIPDSARILAISYSPQGAGLRPLEVHGEIPVRAVPRKLALYPVPFGGVEPKPTEVAVAVVWVDEPDEELWHHLFASFESYQQGRLVDAIIPANVAVEARLSQFMTTILSRSAPAKRVEDFLTDGATYSHQLNVLLPALVPSNVPQLRSEIRGQLNLLKKLRNDLAHRGTPRVQIDKNATAEMLCAALFGFHYVRMVDALIRIDSSTSSPAGPAGD